MFFDYVTNSSKQRYYYLWNQIEVIGLIAEDGTNVVNYSYDAYGNATISGSLASSIGKINPIIYRGYYYDHESLLYYCKSRYYSLKLCRFIQPLDVSSLNPSSINGLNLYIYANNNPIGIMYRNSRTGETVSGRMNSHIGNLANNIFANSKTSWWSRYPAVPSGLNHISKVNDVFSAASHSANVSIYLQKNLSFIDDMAMQGINPATALGKLPKAGWLNKIGYIFSAIDAAVTYYDNRQQGNSIEEALLDSLLTFGKSTLSAWIGGVVGTNVGGLIGAGLGLLIPIPGVGAAIGFVLGTATGVVVAWFVDDILGLIKDGILDLIFD